jgi:hypothetical protein
MSGHDHQVICSRRVPLRAPHQQKAFARAEFLDQRGAERDVLDGIDGRFPDEGRDCAILGNNLIHDFLIGLRQACHSVPDCGRPPWGWLFVLAAHPVAAIRAA